MRVTVLLLVAGWAAWGLLPAAAADSGRGEMVDAYLTGVARKQWEARAAAVAGMRSAAEVRARQQYIREKLLQELGGFPARTPLEPRITGTLQRDGYRVEKLVFQSQPGFFVTANVYVPEGKGPFPAVLGTAGHSDAGKAYEVYQRGWIGLVKRGYVVLAYDPPGQGERLEYLDPATGQSRLGSGGTREHTMAGMQCLLAGSNVATYEIWDGIRAFDYLLTRSDVDPKRIAVAGNSGGGTQSAYLAALEPRLAAAAPSCYLTSWEKLWPGPGPQDAEQVFAGFLHDGLDFGDFLIEFAPKPIEMMTAIRDFFPIEGARATYAEAHRVFGLLDAADHVGFFEYDDPHGWSKPRRETTYRWLDQWLQGRLDDGAEPAFETEPEANLLCTRTGQVATSLGGKTIQALNQEMAERLYPRRLGARAAAPALRAAVARRLGVGGPRGAPHSSNLGEETRDGYRVERLSLRTEPGIELPARMYVPAGSGRRPAVIYVDDRGAAAAGADLESLARTGHIVLAPDLRGWGETASPPGKSGYNGEYQTAMRAILVGKTMAGMQTYDLLRAFDYLAARPDVDARRIDLFGRGNGGTIALYAAALEPRIARVASEAALPSYLDIVRAKQHEGVIDIIVPGVLRDFDLPDLARAVGPGKVWIANARGAEGEHLGDGLVRGEYGSGIAVLDRADGQPFTTAYRNWLR